ncbi:nucleotide exchange factor GrpE [Exiguobacterium marinum]|uniref:Nucleotide exchange factor GrpE n=1 Tax=Exiguobacterium marinum TaxID=273528 RepID=A0ABY7X336_9BACL|nr:nucleotide exchange factor GrpE [Exiguobacterium marinum]WDH75349.1 nucleotide exchange factor GrpE [Exiguobacterium marinum]
MNVIKNNQIKNSKESKLVGFIEFFSPLKKETTNIWIYNEFINDLTRLWKLSPNDLTAINAKIRSHERKNYEIDFSDVDSVDQNAAVITLKYLEGISLEECNLTSEAKKRYLQVEETLSIDCNQINQMFAETIYSTSHQVNVLYASITDKAEITFFNEIVSVSIKLIELAPQLEKEILPYLLKLIPVPLYSYYLSQKGKLKDMESLSYTDKLKKVCQNYLEMSVQSPPVIHRTPHINQDVVEQIEQIIVNETKQAKRMTFKTAEEIKQVILDASGVKVETSSSEDRNKFIHTSIELYDSMFHLVRMFKTNGNEELHTATAKELKRMELLLKELDLEAIETIGKKIDPAYMQGVAVVPSVEANGLEQYVVYDEIRKGFKDLKENRVIREAQVITVLN